MTFVTETLYIVRFVPDYACACGANDWSRTTAFFAPESALAWTGHTFCMTCHNRFDWVLDPDKPIEHQAVPSKWFGVDD